MGEEKPLRVLIIGAGESLTSVPATPQLLTLHPGSAGLLAAHGLRMVAAQGQGKIEYTVFEKDGDLAQRPRDWNFGIYWAQSRLEECLPSEVREGLQSVQTEYVSPPASSWPGGPPLTPKQPCPRSGPHRCHARV